MSITENELADLVEEYVRALAGQEVLEAIRFHADKAGVNYRFIPFTASVPSVVVVSKIFRAAQGQSKLATLVSIIREDFRDFGSGLSSFEEDKPGLAQNEAELEDFYSYRKWLAAETELVNIRGIGERKAGEAITFPILELYTELYVQTGMTNLDLDKGRMRGQKRISLTKMVDSTRCLLIMGDPGSGKTTFLRYIARSHALEHGGPLPIYFRLADVYEYAASNRLPLGPETFLGFWLDLSEKEDLNLTKESIEDACRTGKCLWLLDSLDELPSADVREKMVQAVERAARKWDKCKFVLTSRPLPVKARAIPVGFTKVGIDHWTADEIRAFLIAWTALLYRDASEEIRRRHWGSLMSTIMERSDLRGLAKNAVMVTAMAVVHWNERRLPEGRADLIEALIYWLLRAKIRPVDSSSFIEQRYRDLALAMFEAEGGRRRRVGRLWAAERIAKHFDGSVEAALEFLAREETERGVLVRRGEGDLEFWHLSFQEYLAAKEIAGKLDDTETGWWSRVRDRLDTGEWREVLIFVPACLNRLGSERVKLFFERLAESCASSDLPSKARRVALGGSILRDLRLTGFELKDDPSWSQILNDVLPVFGPEGENVPIETRYEVAVAYGLGGDERIRDFEDTWVTIPGGTFLMGAQTTDSSAPNYDPDAALWEGPVIEITLESFDIRKYPVTVHEFAQFVLDDGYVTSLYWADDAWEWLTTNGILAPLDWEEQLLMPNCPITGVSWFEANAYCKWLTSQEIREGFIYRLPSESEWEYTARRGLPSSQRFPWGNAVTPGEKVECNCAWSGLRRKTPIGMFHKCLTSDGVVDLNGNVEEWCADSWLDGHARRPRSGEAWSDESVRWRVVRGGSTIRFARLCRSTYRSRIYKDKRYHPVGFRPVRVRLG